MCEDLQHLHTVMFSIVNYKWNELDMILSVALMFCSLPGSSLSSQ